MCVFVLAEHAGCTVSSVIGVVLLLLSENRIKNSKKKTKEREIERRAEEKTDERRVSRQKEDTMNFSTLKSNYYQIQKFFRFKVEK